MGVGRAPPMNCVNIPLDFLPADLGENERELLATLMESHRQAARNNANLSKAVAVEAWRGSGSFVQAACAGCLTIGGLHAPIAAARKVWCHATITRLTMRVRDGEKVPGFGNSFFKDRIDPAFEPVAELLKVKFPMAASHLDDLTEAVWRGGKRIFPNAALLTAAVCELIGIPEGIEEALFILARLPVWAADMMFVSSHR